MRITINVDEYNIIQSGLNNLKTIEAILLKKNIDEQYNKTLVIKSSKQKATKKAILTKINTVKNKITNTVNMMNLENKKINVNSVATESNVAYNTVKKYKYLLFEIK